MIGLDTNILIRFLTRDDPALYKKVEDFFKLHRGARFFVSQTVLLETWWVLIQVYQYPVEDIVQVLLRLIDGGDIVVENYSAIVSALKQVNTNNVSFEDALIAEVNAEFGCEYTITFDRKATRIKGMKLLE